MDYGHFHRVSRDVATQVEVLRSVKKTIGSLALAYPYLRWLRVAESIAELVTKGWERDVPTGQVIEVLVLNRLSLRPAAISKVGLWARTQAVEEVHRLEGETLNDDRIGRALDEIHPRLTDLWAAIALRGAQSYGVSLRSKVRPTSGPASRSTSHRATQPSWRHG